MKYIVPLLFLLICGCKSTTPGRLNKLTKQGIPYQNQRSPVTLPGATGKKISVQYLGCGGLYIVKNGDGIMIDPFFSHQKIMRLGISMFSGRNGKRKLATDPKMVERGIKSIEKSSGEIRSQITGILTAHSHYDHLMDVPAVLKTLGTDLPVYVNQSGFNTCLNVIDSNRMIILEKHMTTHEVTRAPIVLKAQSGKIHVYPIFAEHNPHFKSIKFFSGSKVKPVDDYKDPYQKTKANDWLEGNTFSFLIDYIDANGEIEFRMFVQSSSCNPPAGIPPEELLRKRNVDMAFLGVVSHHFSPDYPCTLLASLNPKEVVWIHWEDFFRKYSKKPRTVRGTDVVKFFDVPCVTPYKSKALIPWPGVTLDVSY
jgi:hypothetical protein